MSGFLHRTLISITGVYAVGVRMHHLIQRRELNAHHSTDSQMILIYNVSTKK